MLIDTHAHLYFGQFDGDRAQVIQRALQAGVKCIINIGVDLPTSKTCIEMAEKQAGLLAAVGIHPNDAATVQERDFQELQRLARHPAVVAIGEIGLDFYRQSSEDEVQKKVFRRQVRLAREVGLPIIIHNRQAGREIVKILQSEETDGLTGVFHCFSECPEVAEAVLDLGFHISFTGNLTFKKSALPEVAKSVPLNRLLLETDCPFLSPEPRRGRRNEPANVVYIAQKLAEIKQCDEVEVQRTTTQNAVHLFNLGDKEME